MNGLVSVCVNIKMKSVKMSDSEIVTQMRDRGNNYIAYNNEKIPSFKLNRKKIKKHPENKWNSKYHWNRNHHANKIYIYIVAFTGRYLKCLINRITKKKKRDNINDKWNFVFVHFYVNF